MPIFFNKTQYGRLQMQFHVISIEDKIVFANKAMQKKQSEDKSRKREELLNKQKRNQELQLSANLTAFEAEAKTKIEYLCL